MQNTLIGLLALVLIGGFGWYAFSDKAAEQDAMIDESAMEKDDAMVSDHGGDTKMEGDSMEKDDSMMQDGEETMMKAGSYEDYSADKLARANDGKVVLFFHASWCPTCRALDADIKANLGNIPAGVTILKTNYDRETELKKKYGVTYQHTFVQVDASGAQITKWGGSSTLAALVANIK